MIAKRAIFASCYESCAGVVAGLVPATPNFKAPSKSNRGGRDKPGHDPGEPATIPGEMPSTFQTPRQADNLILALFAPQSGQYRIGKHGPLRGKP